MGDKTKAVPPPIYPWSNDRGLCSVLDDPGLWAWLISDANISDSASLRRDIKQLFKRTIRNSTLVVSIDNDESFGAAVAELMRTPHGRSTFLAGLTEWTNITQIEQYLPRAIYRFAETVTEDLPQIEEICDEQEDERWYLVPDRFTAWLGEYSDLARNSAQGFALLGCAFAVLQPDESGKIYSTLVTFDGKFRELLGSKQLERSRRRGNKHRAKLRRKRSTTGADSRASEVSADPVSESRSDHHTTARNVGVDTEHSADDTICCRPLTRILLQDAYWNRELAIANLKSARSMLEEEVTSLQAELTAVTELEQNALDRLTRVEQLPILKMQLMELPSVPTVADQTLSAAREQLAESIATYSRIEAAAQALEELAKRTGKSKIEVHFTNFDPISVAERLEAEHVAAGKIVTSLARRDARVRELLQELLESPQETRVQLAGGLDVQYCRDLAEAVFGERLCRTEKDEADPVTIAIERLRGRFDVVGLVVALLWNDHPEEASEIADHAIYAAHGDRTKELGVLSFLSFSRLRHFAELKEHWTGMLLELVVATAIKANDVSVLNWIRPLLFISNSRSPCWTVYEQLARVSERGDVRDVRMLFRGCGERKVDGAAEVAELISRPPPPGGGATYYDLREKARELFLFPLEGYVAQNRPDKAVAIWRGFGTLDDMVERCARKLPAKRVVESRHRKNSHSYLAEFQDRLLEWNRIAQEEGYFHDEELSHCVESLKSEGGQLTSECKRLSELLTHDPGDKGVLWPPSDFGNRCGDDSIVRHGRTNGLVLPIMFNSWIAAASGDEVPLASFVADVFGRLLCEEPDCVNADLIDEFLARRAFHAARLAVGDDKELSSLVENHIQGIRAQFLADNEILREAQKYREDNDSIELLVAEVETCLERCAFTDARYWLDDLEDLVIEHRWQVDPETKVLIAVLREAGEEVVAGDSFEAMQMRVANIFEAATNRREHIEMLRGCAKRLPASMEELWNATATRLDTPARWPKDADTSLEYATWIEFCGLYLSKQWSRRLQDPELYDQLIEELGAWFVDQLSDVGASDPDRPDFDVFEQLQHGVTGQEFWGPREVLEYIGAKPVERRIIEGDSAERYVTLPSGAEATDSIALPFGVEAVVPDKAQPERKLRFIDVVADIREHLRLSLEIETTPVEASDEALKDVCSRRDWQQVRVFAANHDSLCDPPHARLTAEERIYAMSLALTAVPNSTGFSRLMLQGCLSAILEKLDREFYYFDEETLQRIAIVCLSRISAPYASMNTELDVLHQEVHTLLERVAKTRRGDNRRWLVELLQTAKCFESQDSEIRGDMWFARWLWDFFTGASKPALPRAQWLDILYDLRHFDVLRDLSQQHASSEHYVISQCLEAFSQADSNPAAIGDAHNLARIVVEQSVRGRNIKPWTLLVTKLDKAPKEFEDTAPCVVNEELITLEGDQLVVQVSLTPSRYKWPEALQLSVVGDDNSTMEFDLLGGKPLTSQRLIPIRLPASAFLSQQQFCRIPYHIVGQSINGSQDISLKGAWTWTWDRDKSATADRFDFATSRQLWPGAEGLAVKKKEAHHGRHDEWRRIEFALRGDDQRQRSLVIVGQRRIGKTSLLNQVLTAYPAKPGRICAAFVNIGRASPTENQSLNEAIFNQVVVQLRDAPGDPNGPIKRAISPSGVVKLSRMFADLRPRESLASAFEGMVDILKQHTNGTITRLAFCLDEFHNIFSWKDEAQIDALMWDLRTIVQQSTKVSLLLAGSGLTRRLVDRYDAALFGSIDCIELKPFSWKVEQDAIADIFMPPEVRAQMTPSGLGFEPLLKKAFELSGGHPWYLSMLGSATAAMFGARPVTPAMLVHVGDEMVAGRVRRDDLEFTAERFYGHLIESLDIIGNRQKSIAELCLLEIARRATTDWPWVAAHRILEHEVMARHSDREERSQALKSLERESVVVKRTERKRPEYRVRIPLVAAALKHDADELEDKALAKLS